MGEIGGRGRGGEGRGRVLDYHVIRMNWQHKKGCCVDLFNGLIDWIGLVWLVWFGFITMGFGGVRDM